MRKVTVIRFVLFLLLVPALFMACERQRSVEDEVRRTLDHRERGLNQQDLKLYLSAISTHYAGSATAYEQVKDRIGSLFAGFDEIQYSSFDRSVYKEDQGMVRVVQRFTMELSNDEGRPQRVSGQEQLFLAPHEGRYLIVEGL